MDLNFIEEIDKRVERDFKGLNRLARPKLTCVSVSMRVGRFKDDAKAVSRAREELALITGQLPSGRKAQKAISSFKLKEDDLVGFLVTLRGWRMWSFVEKLVKVVLPGVRDFRGLKSSSLDRQGNLTIGFRDQTVFVEIDPNKIERSRGLAVSLVAQNIKSQEMAVRYWQGLGFVFSKEP